MKSLQFSSTLNERETKKQRRRYHLGLDWGTSATKLVLRDYEQGKAFVIPHPDLRGSYRYPSTCVIENQKVFFGVEAEARKAGSSRIFEAMKADIYEISASADADEILLKENLSTLYLAHIISTGLDFADRHAARSDSDAVMGMTLGVPAEELEKSVLRHVYLKMARTSYEIAVRMGCDPQGMNYQDCLQVLNSAREKVSVKNTDTSAELSEYSQWLRPELAAAMFWGVKSPTIESDLYSCVDIGAWTTNASYFRIHHADNKAKGGISFYGGACRTPGIIKLLKEVASDQGKDFPTLFGQEDSFLKKNEYRQLVDDYRKRYFDIWKEGFQKAYLKEKSQNAWDGKVNVMIVGGGSKSRVVKGTFYEQFPYKAWAPAKPVPDLGVPADLYDFPSAGTIPKKEFTGDPTFLLVAYGLSVHSKDFPKTKLALQVEPFQPDRRSRKAFVSFDELGFDK